MKKQPLKCLFVASEVAPYAKTGGLADVAGALPKKLKENGVDIRVVMPYYKQMENKFFEHETHYVTSFDVWVNWRKEGVGVYYDDTIVPTYFIRSEHYFQRDEFYGQHDDYERFAYFCKSVLELLKHIDFQPDIIHCNDWQTGPICLMLNQKYRVDPFYEKIKSVFTIHNMKYQGIFGKEQVLDVLELDEGYASSEALEFNGGMSFMKAGLLYSDQITTVSPTYAEEIKTWEYGCGLNELLEKKLYNKVCGILNGIDYERYNPETDTYIYERYDVEHIERRKLNKRAFQNEYGLEQTDSMMIGVISRITDQKGFDLMKQSLDNQWIMDKIMEMDIQFVLLGTGEYEYEEMFKYLEAKYNKRVSIHLKFDEALAQKIYASTDIFLMPSAFEPCGLGQMMAMRYGSVPVVRQTGGLKDTVIHYNDLTKEGTGFEFVDYCGYWLYKKIEEAYECYKNKPSDFKQVQLNAMNTCFSWNHSAQVYEAMYKRIMA
ncbi:MAG: glycogen synthase GlgA [Niameybacter sp.]|uniref:glycogen synthase GlgA n=1 Tax=Niameybacter sp. TaxID=2033640 RepID=UPI002FC58C29